LYDFTRAHPSIDLELTVALSSLLCEMLDAGQLDLAMAKRRLGDDRGQLVRRERLAWMGRETLPIEAEQPIPLVTYPPPSITRAMAIEALEKAQIPWRISCTCGGLIGLRSAALAGFGVMLQPASMVPAGLVELRSRLLPDPGEFEFVLIARAHTAPGPVQALSGAIMQSDYHLPPELLPCEPGPRGLAAVIQADSHTDVCTSLARG
jgi:DNA-binding transcriptional LysR family regulator